jgi:hypothetical protein
LGFAAVATEQNKWAERYHVSHAVASWNFVRKEVYTHIENLLIPKRAAEFGKLNDCNKPIPLRTRMVERDGEVQQLA